MNMKKISSSFLQQINLLIAFVSCLTSILLPLSTKADSTANLLMSLKCHNFQVQVWKNRSSGAYLYRSQGTHGNLKINGGTRQSTEGVTVYKFRNGGYQYWVWDGTLDSKDRGRVEIYRNNRLVQGINCDE
jgi:hypothetical protein